MAGGEMNTDKALEIIRALVRVLKAPPPDSAFKSAKHQIYHGNVNESGAGLGQHLVIFAQATVAVKPGKSPFNHPAARQ